MANDKIGIELVVEGLREFERKVGLAQGETDGLADDLDRVARNTRGLEGASLVGFGAMEVAADLAAQAISRIVDGVVDLTGDTVNVAADFEAQMALMQIASGATGDKLQILRDYAIEMGAKTFESAQGAAEGMTNLLKAGLSPEEVMSVFPAVADLAAASSLTLAESSDAVTVALATWDKPVGDAAGVVDTMVKAADASVTEVNELAAAMQTGGPAASMYGMSFEEFNQTLALFSERGIKGAQAGTLLKSMLLNMTRDTDKVAGAWSTLGINLYDAEGNMRRIPDVMADMSEQMAVGESWMARMALPLEDGEEIIRTFTATTEAEMNKSIEALQEYGFEVVETGRVTEEFANTTQKTLGGSYGVAGLSILGEEGAAGYAEMGEKIDAAASAAEIAEVKFSTFRGTMEELEGSVETVQVKAGTALIDNVLQPITDELNDKTIPAIDKFIEKLTGPDASLQAAFASLIPEDAGGGLFDLFTENLDSLFETLQEMTPEELENLAKGLGAVVLVFNAQAILGALLAGGPLVFLFLALTSGAEGLAEALAALGEGDFKGVVEGLGKALTDTAQDAADLVGLDVDVEGGLAAWQGVADDIALIWDAIFNPETGIITVAWNNFWGVTVPNAITQAVASVQGFVAEVDFAWKNFLASIGLGEAPAGKTVVSVGHDLETGAAVIIQAEEWDGSMYSGQQSGGPVFADTPYMVGEAGPELFMPQRAGVIMPAGMTDRMRGQSIDNSHGDMNVNFYGPVGSPGGVVDRLKQAGVMNGL